MKTLFDSFQDVALKDRVLTSEHIVTIIEHVTPKPGKRGPYEKLTAHVHWRRVREWIMFRLLQSSLSSWHWQWHSLSFSRAAARKAHVKARGAHLQIRLISKRGLRSST